MDTRWTTTGAPNGFVVAVVGTEAALFCQGALEFWILLTGATGMVEFLYGKSRATYVWTTIIQEPKVIVLQVCGNDINRRSQFKATLMDAPDRPEGVLNRRWKFICFIRELVNQFKRRRSVCQLVIRFPFSTFDKAFLASQTLLRGSHIFPEQYNTSPRIFTSLCCELLLFVATDTVAPNE